MAVERQPVGLASLLGSDGKDARHGDRRREQAMESGLSYHGLPPFLGQVCSRRNRVPGDAGAMVLSPSPRHRISQYLLMIEVVNNQPRFQSSSNFIHPVCNKGKIDSRF